MCNMVKLAIVPKADMDADFDAATQPEQSPAQIAPFIMQQQRQDPPELAAIKRKQQEMCI